MGYENTRETKKLMDLNLLQANLKWFRFIIAKIYNILRYVIPVYYVICVIFLSKKLKYLKNEAREVTICTAVHAVTS